MNSEVLNSEVGQRGADSATTRTRSINVLRSGVTQIHGRNWMSFDQVDHHQHGSIASNHPSCLIVLWLFACLVWACQTCKSRGPVKKSCLPRRRTRKSPDLIRSPIRSEVGLERHRYVEPVPSSTMRNTSLVHGLIRFLVTANLVTWSQVF